MWLHYIVLMNSLNSIIHVHNTCIIHVAFITFTNGRITLNIAIEFATRIWNLHTYKLVMFKIGKYERLQVQLN